MKSCKYRLLILMFLLSGNLLFSQDRKAADLNLYRTMISGKHINPFTRISEETFNQKLDDLLAGAPGLSREQVIVELMKINALLYDEHTIIFPNADYYLPFKFRLFDDGIAIVQTDSLNTEYLLHKILSVNKMPVAGITALLKETIKQDNPSYAEFFVSYYMNNLVVLQGLGVVKNLQKVEFELSSPKGDTVFTTVSAISKTVSVNWKYAVPFSQLLAYRQNRDYWFDYNEGNKILYFNYQHCSEIAGEPFEDFNNKLFDLIAEKKPAKIILDLRWNSGGNSSVLNPFIKSIRKSYLNTDRSFYVLIGPTVMSSSLMNAIELKRTTHATFVGAPTGGNINHFGEIKSFELPDLNLRITYSTKYWENWKNMDGPLVPDVDVPNFYTDFIRAYDKAIAIVSE